MPLYIIERKNGQVNGIKALVIGGSGFVGTHLTKHFSCLGTSRSGESGSLRLDVLDAPAAKRMIREISPDMIINASGLTNVDYCEVHPEEAMNINGYAVEVLADAAEEIDSEFFHISTDYVFSGENGNYSEDSETGPVNVYGRSKLVAENLLADRKCTVLRISTPYGINYSGKKKTFMEFVLSSLREGHIIRIVSDQFTTPTYVNEIPVAIEKLFAARKRGIFNLGSAECISRLEFSLILAEVFSLDASKIMPVKTSEFGFTAKRPMNTCMNISKVSETFRPNTIKKNLEEIRKYSTS
jgi:dTDP-4-dehydrorhamnose reductase